MEEELRKKDKFKVIVSYYQISISMPVKGSSVGVIPGDVFQAELHLEEAIKEHEHKNSTPIKQIDLIHLKRIVVLAISCNAIAISNLIVNRNDYGRNCLNFYVSFEDLSSLQNFENNIMSFKF